MVQVHVRSHPKIEPVMNVGFWGPECYLCEREEPCECGEGPCCCECGRCEYPGRLPNDP